MNIGNESEKNETCDLNYRKEQTKILINQFLTSHEKDEKLLFINNIL